MNEKRRPRSAQYQALFTERSVAPELLDSFSDQDNVFKRLNPYDYSDEILDLEEQLRKEFWRLIETYLTPKQQQIVKLIASGHTQQETAKNLSVNQSSISKALGGNAEYQLDGSIKIYGGIERKLRKIADKDPKIKMLLEKIAELREDVWIKE